VRDLVSMAAAATERCRVWPNTAARVVKCVRAHFRGAGSIRHPANFPVVFGELIHANSRVLVVYDTLRTKKKNASNLTHICFAPGSRSLVAETWDPSTVTIAVLSPGRTRRPRTRHLSQCS